VYSRRWLSPMQICYTLYPTVDRLGVVLRTINCFHSLNQQRHAHSGGLAEWNGIRHINKVTLHRARLILGQVTTFGGAKPFGKYPTIRANSGPYPQQDRIWVLVKAGLAHFTCELNVWMAGKNCDCTLTHATPEHLRNKCLVIKFCTNLQIYFYN